MRQIISTALVALVVGAVAGATMGAVAQSPAQGPAAEPIIAPAVSNINAHKVDGKHAVGAKASRAKRAGKLVATNKAGYLPGNIVKPAWKLIGGKPAGFADGVDNVGVAKVRLLQIDGAEESVAAGGGVAGSFLACPEGWVVVGGGYATTLEVVESRPDGPSDPTDPWGWEVVVERDPAETKLLSLRVTCIAVNPPGAFDVRNQKNVPAAQLSRAQLRKRN